MNFRGSVDVCFSLIEPRELCTSCFLICPLIQIYLDGNAKLYTAIILEDVPRRTATQTLLR